MLLFACGAEAGYEFLNHGMKEALKREARSQRSAAARSQSGLVGSVEILGSVPVAHTDLTAAVHIIANSTDTEQTRTEPRFRRAEMSSTRCTRHVWAQNGALANVKSVVGTRQDQADWMRGFSD
jgi:hypothetical protein